MKKKHPHHSLWVLLLIVLSGTMSCAIFDSDSKSEEEDPVSDPVIIEPGEIVSSRAVTINEVTFFFDQKYPTGTFVNGDFWVLGPVVIERISPDFDGESYGWEVNPVVEGGQGFQTGCQGDGFDLLLIPSLPYKADPSNGILSIVKTIPSGGARPCIKTAEVLTIVDEIPPGNGAEVFRPPYVGSDKPYYFVRELRTDKLPSYDMVDYMPDLDTVTERFRRLRLDHKTGVMGRSLRPQDAMADYQPDNTGHQSEAVLRFMMDSPIEDRRDAMVPFVQFGIDKVHMLKLGNTWPPGGGHQPGHLLVLAFTAVMLDLEDTKQTLREATFFHGSTNFVRSVTDNLTLWGVDDSWTTEWSYWNYIMTSGGNRSHKDPYGYIDGGRAPDGAYQFITAQSHKGEILATHLMPELKQAWNMEEWQMIQNYVDRWVLHGLWTLPDLYAPFDGEEGHYGQTFGADPTKPGDGIRGDGRYPKAHGKFRDEGRAYSRFVAAMWDQYRAQIPEAHSEIPYAMVINPLHERTVRQLVPLAATAFSIHGVASVQFLLDDTPLGHTLTRASDEHPTRFELPWETNQFANGPYSITALVTDKKGNTYTSTPIIVEVKNGM